MTVIIYKKIVSLNVNLIFIYNCDENMCASAEFNYL